MQSRAMSLLESIANIVVGFVVAVLAQMIVFPLFGIEASFAQNLGVGIAFTAVSLHGVTFYVACSMGFQ